MVGLTRRMHCVELGDPTLLRLVEESTPQPAPGEVLIQTEAVGVSFVDGLIVRGAYQVRPPLPFTPGNCVVGVVAAVGSPEDEALLGQRVASVLDGVGGAYATHVLTTAETLAAVPAGIAPDVAAASMESYLTVLFATTHRVTIAAGEEVVVLGAGGGIGLAAVDVARSLGARVTGVASSEEKRAAAQRAGASTTLDYGDPRDLKDRIRETTCGGADVVIDPVGGQAAEGALRSLTTGGRYCVVGFASGEIPRLPANIVLLRNRSVIGVDWGDWSRVEGGAAGNALLLTDLLARIARGELAPPAPSSAPLADAGRVLTSIGERRAVGRYVLRMS
ncbi:zinc-binding dehydrogenase [Nocardioides sp.]|uniref:zinc-binding dehydrogenase n=1 Tax=Nocardioides sp. TaxID=35761 RepID=UPI00261128BB|nr:zinc-binding dehydrogenase [Nocardioides sp.]